MIQGLNKHKKKAEGGERRQCTWTEDQFLHRPFSGLRTFTCNIPRWLWKVFWGVHFFGALDFPSSTVTSHKPAIAIVKNQPKVQDRGHHKELHLWQVREKGHRNGQHGSAQDQTSAIPPVVGPEAEKEKPAVDWTTGLWWFHGENQHGNPVEHGDFDGKMSVKQCHLYHLGIVNILGAI